MAATFPEYALFATDADRAAARRDAGRAHFRYSLPIGALTCVVVVLIGDLLGLRCTRWGLERVVNPGLFGGVAFALVLWVTRWLTRTRTQRFLRERLVANGIPVCMSCGYDLRGQTEARCPECGTAFDQRLVRRAAPERTTRNDSRKRR